MSLAGCRLLASTIIFDAGRQTGVSRHGPRAREARVLLPTTNEASPISLVFLNQSNPRILCLTVLGTTLLQHHDPASILHHARHRAEATYPDIQNRSISIVVSFLRCDNPSTPLPLSPLPSPLPNTAKTTPSTPLHPPPPLLNPLNPLQPAKQTPHLPPMRPHLRFQGLQLHPKPRLVRLQPRLFRLQLLGSSLEAVEGWLGVGSVSVSVKRWGIEGGGGDCLHRDAVAARGSGMPCSWFD